MDKEYEVIVTVRLATQFAPDEAAAREHLRTQLLNPDITVVDITDNVMNPDLVDDPESGAETDDPIGL